MMNNGVFMILYGKIWIVKFGIRLFW